MTGSQSVRGWMWLICLAGVAPVYGAEPAVGLQVHPATAVVSHPRFPQQLVVGRQLPGGAHSDLTRTATYVSADPAIARVDERGRIWPVAVGVTKVTVTAEGLTAEVAVQSVAPTIPVDQISYADEAQPILSKARCNQGACHGYSLGKNGFRLSLRGADAEYDHFAITKEFFGRRVDHGQPEASLLLTKPVGDVPHQGGTRFKRDSELYRRLARWIGEGAPSDLGKTPALERVEVFPTTAVLAKAGEQQQLQVTAVFADGTRRDVTPFAIFSSGNEEHAEVTEDGLVKTLRPGEAAIQVRYERSFAVSNIAALESAAEFAWQAPAPRNFIDQHVFAKLQSLRINPSALSSDTEFLRRVSLDLIGTIPTAEEVRAFLANADPQKREKLVDALLTRPEYVDRWSLKWGDLLQNSRRSMSEESMYVFRDWIRHAVASNMPLDQFAREVLTGEGPVRESATAAFYRVSTDPKISLERTAQVFTGVRMLCARCHPHPFENWTQADYYGLASFFNQVTEKVDPKDPQEKVVFLNRAVGYAVNPRTNQLQPPRFLGGGEPEVAAGVDRRVVFAEWLTKPENPYFARSLVNRYWSYFFSRGIIDPVDDIRTTNPPINPELLDALAADFAANKFDVRRLLRTIVLSHTYQASSVANPSNLLDLDNFSHAVPRRLSAEQLLDSVVVATGIPENLQGAPGGFRAAQAPDTNVTSEFLDLFGRAPRMEACECERTSDTNLLQALHMINGNTILQKVLAPNSRLATIVNNAQTTPEQKIDEIYLWTLNRLATAEERALAQQYVGQAAQPAEGYQDLMWALLNSREFLFVH